MKIIQLTLEESLEDKLRSDRPTVRPPSLYEEIHDLKESFARIEALLRLASYQPNTYQPGHMTTEYEVKTVTTRTIKVQSEYDSRTTARDRQSQSRSEKESALLENGRAAVHNSVRSW